MVFAKRSDWYEPAAPIGEEQLPPEVAQQSAPLVVYASIATISSAVLIFELALTRIFSVMLWSNLAFMVVGTALFGFGLSGVYLAIRPDPVGVTPQWLRTSLARLSLAMAWTMLGSYLVVSYVPFRMWQKHLGIMNVVGLAAWEVALVAPFFCAGLCIARILGAYPRRAGSLYGVDLLGAALGSVAFVPVITWLGAPASIVVAGMLGVLCALFVAKGISQRLTLASVASLVILMFLMVNAETLLPVRFHQEKRHFLHEQGIDRELASRWSALSRVDISENLPATGPLRGHETRAIWIDGGTNASPMLKIIDPIDSLPPQEWNSLGAADALKQGTAPRVLVIGAAGGRETLFALTFGASHVDALEMDPSVFDFVQRPEFASYMGNVYENPRVTLINDEGRSFLRRTAPESYDIIQSVNNYTPAAMAAGALNVSETFLLTKEAFLDYFDHLTADGVIAFHRGAALRVALTAITALRARGVEHPEQCIVVTNGDFDNFQGIFIKKRPWTEAEVDVLGSYLSKIRHYGDKLFLWSPVGNHTLDSLYARVISGTPEQQASYYSRLGVDLDPATDDHPFVEHYSQYGHRKLSATLPPEFLKRESEKWHGKIPRGDFPYVMILVESCALALLFVGLPLILWARGGVRAEGFFGYLAYFAALGFSFIVIEVCLMKRFVLFLGHPAYSVTAILVFLLLGAGLGSILSERLGLVSLRRTMMVMIACLCGMLLGQAALSPMVFQWGLGFSLAGRLAVAGMLLVPLGVLMGMPFSFGMRMINTSVSDIVTRRQLLAWAWGMNGYATVIGSASTLFLALALGFKWSLYVATLGYIVGLAALLVATRRGGV